MKLKVEGNNKLKGTVAISGNKNAILPMIAASLLTDEKIILKNVPDIVDVRHMLQVLDNFNSSYSFENSILTIENKNISSYQLSQDLCKKTRTSILYVAPLLYRCKKAVLFPPGGDVIGRRRLDTHFYGLQKLGADINITDKYEFSLKDTFTGSDLFFDEASVTATEHILMASVIAKNDTYIRNAACEPHVQDLAILLNKMGARIQGIGTNTLYIQGVDKLKGATHTVCSDHIEAVSFLALAAACKSPLTVTNIQKSHHWMTHRVFATLGVNLDVQQDKIILSDQQSYAIQKDIGNAIPKISDGPWPQLASDMLSMLIVMATQMEGTCLFFEKMFESRIYFVDKLIAMGANAIVCDPHRVVITGKAQLQGTKLFSPDIRAGMAMVSAALCAKGTSIIDNIEMIDRGYENIDKKLAQIGAKITRIDN